MNLIEKCLARNPERRDISSFTLLSKHVPCLVLKKKKLLIQK